MKNLVTVDRVHTHTHTHTNSLENNKVKRINIIINKIEDSNIKPVIIDTG